MAGLLAANIMTRRKPVVIEAQSSLPNNHSAVLRFRSSQIGDILGIPFKKVSMTKGYVPWRNPVADSLAYARKCTGTYRSDRSIISSGIEVHERYISPPDLIWRMAEEVEIFYNTPATDVMKSARASETIISTIPMPALMNILEYPRRGEVSFEPIHGLNLKSAFLDTEAYSSLYVPSPELGFNRVSLTGNELTAEYSFPLEDLDGVKEIMDRMSVEEEAASAYELFGIEAQASSPAIVKLQRYSKIIPIKEEIRRDFMHWATDQFSIYSLGRFATWRPGLLLDDLVKDIRLIDGWITSKSGYDVKLHRG